MVLFSAEKRIVHDLNFNKKKLLISHISMKFTSKSPYIGIWNFVKKSDFFYRFTNVSKFLILQKKTKKKTKKHSKKILKLPLIMWFSNFSTKKSNFIKKINFSIDNDFQYFSPKNHFLYWKNGFQKILEVKKKFSQQQ